jgi:uncharacterized protein
VAWLYNPGIPFLSARAQVGSIVTHTGEFTGPGPLAIYQAAVAQGKFHIQQCKDCGQHVFYPRVLCPHCGAADLKWVQPSGRGVVYATSTVRQKADKGGDYNVSLIELAEGPRMLSRVMESDLSKIKIGMKVSAHIGLIDGAPAVVFYALEQGSKEW